MKIRIKSNEDVENLIEPINNSISQFISKWINPKLLEHIKLKCFRINSQKSEYEKFKKGLNFLSNFIKTTFSNQVKTFYF